MKILNANGESIINAKVAVSLKYFNNFWEILETAFFINCEINLTLTWSAIV